MQTIAISIDVDTLGAVDRLRRSSRRRGKRPSRSELIREILQRHIAEEERAAAEARDAEIIRKHHQQLNREAGAAIRFQARL